MAAVADKVKSIIVEQLGVDEEEVTPDASFVDDLGGVEHVLARRAVAKDAADTLERLDRDVVQAAVLVKQLPVDGVVAAVRFVGDGPVGRHASGCLGQGIGCRRAPP